MTSISRAFVQGARLAFPLIAAALLPACRAKGPDVPATFHRDTAAPVTQSTPLPDSGITSPAPGSGIDTSAAVTGETPGTAPAGAGLSPGWKRAELVEGVRSFVGAIDSGNERQFWGSLSGRSRSMVDGGGLGPRSEIWENAKATLADIRNRKITVVGGTADSVALRIDGERLVDGVRENDPVIIGLLREKGDWKVMYPGLMYPEHHLRR
ncbi:MAG: hypothetical protein JWQ98_1846 [Chlorobi bacterium]|nr:hypothetical protein [Chlorobiota bacterium]